MELAELIERRRRLGQDLFDEVWEGVLHINPAPTGGHARVDQQVAELLGARFDFYAVHEVDEVLIVDREKRAVEWLR